MNITIHFNASHNHYGVYTHGTHLLNGGSIHMMETINGGNEITNYSLTHHNTANKDLRPTAEYDLILIAPTGKAHMNDIFSAIQGHGLRYRQLFIFACRINKLA